MTAPEREALVKALRDASDGWSGDAFCVSADIAAQAADMIEANAPAVTVTEEMIEELRILSGSASSAEWHRNYAVSKKLWREFDAKLDAIKAALKSTTPQTGSQQ